MNKQKQFFINGLILIMIATFATTVIPFLIDKLKIVSEKGFFTEFAFFTLAASAIFYIFSPKYYKEQVLSVIFAIIFYLLFIKISYPS